MATKADIMGLQMTRLPPEVNRILLVRNLPFNVKVRPLAQGEPEGARPRPRPPPPRRADRLDAFYASRRSLAPW